MRDVTVREMREIDRQAIQECGIQASRLMGRAGEALARETRGIISRGKVLILAGYGNNGGDGLAAAGILARQGYTVWTFLAGSPKPFTPETGGYYRKLLAAGQTVQTVSRPEDIPAIFREPPDLIIDAVFGIGIHGALDEFYRRLITETNRLNRPVVSADVPSGLDADLGEPCGNLAIKASVTVTFGYPKIGFRNPKARIFTGRVTVADIGFPKTGWKGRVRQLKSETYALSLAMKDPRTPWYAKLLAAGVLAYLLSPVDLIPDFIPVIGYLDDLILVPAGLALAVKLIPVKIWLECRSRSGAGTPKTKTGASYGAGPIKKSPPDD